MEKMNLDRYLCLEKMNESWRMDGATFTQFMRHVSSYFKTSNGSGEINFKNIEYADIASDDLFVVSAIFGAYSPNDKKMILAPVNPGTFILPWLNYFTLNVCESLNGKERHWLLLLESK
jgi:hypothetical protein